MLILFLVCLGNRDDSQFGSASSNLRCTHTHFRSTSSYFMRLGDRLWSFELAITRLIGNFFLWIDNFSIRRAADCTCYAIVVAAAIFIVNWEWIHAFLLWNDWFLPLNNYFSLCNIAGLDKPKIVIALWRTFFRLRRSSLLFFLIR